MGELRVILRDRKEFCLCLAGVLCLFILCSCSNNQVNMSSQPPARPAAQKAEHNNPGVKCTEDSPERRGEEGCTILANRPLVGSLAKPVYWHIDRFDSLEAAKKAAGPDGVAAEAHGGVWLTTVEPQTEVHHGGRHVAWIGPLVLPAADRYSMRVQSSLLKPGFYDASPLPPDQRDLREGARARRYRRAAWDGHARGDRVLPEPDGAERPAGGPGGVHASRLGAFGRRPAQPGERPTYRRDAEARGKGVLVLLNDQVSSARDATKQSTYRTDAFQAGEYGYLGSVDADRVVFYRNPTRRHTTRSEFRLDGVTTLPRVDVVYSYAGADGVMIDAVTRAGARGIVIAGTGAGDMTHAESDAVLRAREAGVAVVRGSRVGAGRVFDQMPKNARAVRPWYRDHGIIASDNLTPQKARVLLMLALAANQPPREIQRMFNEY